MRRTILFTAALATAAALAAAGARASDDDAGRTGAVPEDQWMSVAALAQKLEAQGYTVREIERDDGYYEVEMTDAKGMRVEAYLDPVTGEPVARRDDD